MSELINNSALRKEKLKELILKLHSGQSVVEVRKQLEEALGKVPYGEVVEVEQELIADGLPESEILELCDLHSEALRGKVDLTQLKLFPDGHPVDVFQKENSELRKLANQIRLLLSAALKSEGKEEFEKNILTLRVSFNNLMDVDKHYKRKEYLLFPYLEKMGITGPPKVMWGKHDEIREMLNGCIELLGSPEIDRATLNDSIDLLITPSINQIEDMTLKEEEILLPMSLDKLTEAEWYDISTQSLEIGYCLYDPLIEWKPKWASEPNPTTDLLTSSGGISMPSGSFSKEELLAILNTVPLDMTFVDKDDKVKYFTQGTERIFQRSRAILNRDVRHCHPPASAHIVDKIIDDFKSGKESNAPFWIQLHGKFVHIEYFALRNESGEYLGTLEVSQDLTKLRALEGEQRILSYSDKKGDSDE